MKDPFFFGYGSLVNRRTHGYGQIRLATARGWRRTWRHTAHRDIAILTAEPAPGVEIAGLIAAVPGADWAALDAREAFYDRVPCTADLDLAPASGDGTPDIALYTIPAAKHPAAPAPCRILLSYLDVVVQGYLAEFGPEGVAAFFATTTGWDAPVLDDRSAPLYPRAQALSAAETALVDAHLARLGARRVTA